MEYFESRKALRQCMVRNRLAEDLKQGRSKIKVRVEKCSVKEGPGAWYKNDIGKILYVVPDMLLPGSFRVIHKYLEEENLTCHVAISDCTILNKDAASYYEKTYGLQFSSCNAEG